MASGFQEYHVQLIDARTGSPIDDDAADYVVMTAGTPAIATTYTNDQGTSLTTPTTTTDGEIRFFTDSSVQSVDISGMMSASGYSGIPFFIKGLTPSQHRFEINADQYTGHVFVVPWTFSASVSHVTTSLDIRTENIVKRAQVRQTTAGPATSSMLQFGVSSTLSGFIGNCSCTTTGWKKHSVPLTGVANSILATITHALIHGAELLMSYTNVTLGQSTYRPADSNSGSRITFKDTAGTGATAAGYLYLHMDRIVA